ncbi:hypothetical protein MRB53_003502 [Persea americana]|uniref:Uncharacterized protein n=1 Tax=Persea americana TaxID=3435 RepID=A0ACC2MXP1_PERAE|nr:hypothetical protein MRB53_003502 [Persea americana]
MTQPHAVLCWAFGIWAFAYSVDHNNRQQQYVKAPETALKVLSLFLPATSGKEKKTKKQEHKILEGNRMLMRGGDLQCYLT